MEHGVLTVAQFQRLLFQGRGHAVLHLQRRAAAPYREALRAGCLHNPCYYREGHRAAFYLDLIALTGEERWYRDQIVDALADPSDDDDIDQLLALALHWAQQGDALARQRLYEQVAEQAREGTTIGADYLIALDGADGFRFVAERLGEAVLLGEEVWEHDGLLDALEERAGAAVTAALLEKLRSTNRRARSYLELVEAARRRPAPQRLDPTTLSYADIAQRIREGERGGPPLLRRWAAVASDADLALAAHDTLAEADPEQLAVRLLIFDRRAFPFGPEPLLPLLANANERVVVRAYNALGQLNHPTVRALALQLLAERRQLDHAVGLLAANYRAGDYALVAAALATVDDDNTLHNAGFDLLDLLKAHSSPDAAPALLSLYERGPCAFCREHAVAALRDLSALPAWIAEECRFDAYEGVREMVDSPR
jgi:hypothetical protein